MFAWERSDLPDVPREVVEHHLAVCPGARPIQQRVRRQAQDRQDFINEEVRKLKKAKVVREVLHPTWMANPVVVLKANGKKRLCIDFTDLNKACPKDPFPLPRIDQIVDSTAGCDLLCFLDAFSRYHQIKMAMEDEEKTAFITPGRCYFYICMPFGLKNAGATFQRAMRECLGSQMGRNVEAYMDDVVVKRKSQDTLIQDLRETFDSLRKVHLMLNPKKCPVRQAAWFLGVAPRDRGQPRQDQSHRRDTTAPEDQGRSAPQWVHHPLGRFISRLGERALPSFKLLNKRGPVEWT